MVILRYYDVQAFDAAEEQSVWRRLRAEDGGLASVRMERCFHLEHSGVEVEHSLPLEELLIWLVKQPMNSGQSLTRQPVLHAKGERQLLLEIGPRFNFSTPFSTNCVNIFHNLGYTEVLRMEASTRYLLTFNDDSTVAREASRFVPLLGDRMTQCLYTAKNTPKASFNEQLPAQLTDWHFVSVLEEGRPALVRINQELGLAFTDYDLDFYHDLFAHKLGRNPTTVELFDCAQSNSEHSRHWFFRGRMVIDGEEQPKSLIRMIMDTQAHTNPNNTIKFSDNSSAMIGFKHDTVVPSSVVAPGPVRRVNVESDLIFTAETHNMPTAVAPFSGATTGTGGRLRDVQGVGRGGVPIAGTAGYCVGAIHIPGYKQPYEPSDYKYPTTFAPPLQILIEASNGASDYGNKFGEPVICGFALSYGLNSQADASQRDEYVKPIMFSGGLGTMPAAMREKLNPVRGQLLAKIGGPVYRIGVGGGAASSVEVQGSGDAELDFNAVQRGDAEMENKVNRVVRSCLELGDQNPILAIHDQGAGGNGNVLKELVEPGFAGAVIFSKEFQLGDPTITALELWGAEYQENNAILCKAEDRELLEKICQRERCPISFVGVVTGNGRVTLLEQAAPKDVEKALTSATSSTKPAPFDLELKYVLGDMPKRTYELSRETTSLKSLVLPSDLGLDDALKRVLSLVAVGSKRFLTNKVDRCVGGLIAQQQCVGPLQAPLADFALTTVSHFNNAGIATSIGTQPLKGLLDPAAMARMCVAEALSNLVFVKISELADVKCSGNWMWAAKLPGEGAKMYDACKELCQILEELHIAIDGGKDSLSMAAKVGGETIKSPGTLVISTYAPCPDVRLKVTPDLKGPSSGSETALLWISLEEKFRLGGSALAQAYAQQGNECPSLAKTDILAKAFVATQTLLEKGLLLAGHDISDGGLLVCLVEMAIGGLSGLDVDLSEPLSSKLKNFDEAALKLNRPELALLFAEECGWVVEVHHKDLDRVRSIYKEAGVPNHYLGRTKGFGLDGSRVVIKKGSSALLDQPLRLLYQQWERTSYELEKLQANPECAQAEYHSLEFRKAPQYKGPANLQAELILKRSSTPIRVAVLREEGVNSEREMMSCLLRANFEVHDVTMSDLLQGTTTLCQYRGVIFPGGFSYADTLGSAKGWAANILHSARLKPQFEAFKHRQDVFSLGICNGCQLMSLIGFVGAPSSTVGSDPDVALLHNRSQRFECRWSTVKVPANRSIMLQSMKDLILGCWVAHGEGRFAFRDDKLINQLQKEELVTLQYVDDAGEPTERYPLNPNGSPLGIAGLCSPDGRHLALMPHPERCSSMYQWPYVPHDFEVPASGAESPWQLMFNNAYNWCVQLGQ